MVKFLNKGYSSAKTNPKKPPNLFEEKRKEVRGHGCGLKSRRLLRLPIRFT